MTPLSLGSKPANWSPPSPQGLTSLDRALGRMRSGEPTMDELWAGTYAHAARVENRTALQYRRGIAPDVHNDTSVHGSRVAPRDASMNDSLRRLVGVNLGNVPAETKVKVQGSRPSDLDSDRQCGRLERGVARDEFQDGDRLSRQRAWLTKYAK